VFPFGRLIVHNYILIVVYCCRLCSIVNLMLMNANPDLQEDFLFINFVAACLDEMKMKDEYNVKLLFPHIYTVTFGPCPTARCSLDIACNTIFRLRSHLTVSAIVSVRMAVIENGGSRWNFVSMSSISPDMPGGI